LKRLAARATVALSDAFGASFFTFFRLLAFCFLDLQVGVLGFLEPFDVGGECLLRTDCRAGVAMALVEGLLPAAFDGGVVVVLSATAMLSVAVASSIASSVPPSTSSPFPRIA